LIPLRTLLFVLLGAVALAHFVAGRYDDASAWAEKALQERPNFLPAIRELAAAKALAGHHAEASSDGAVAENRSCGARQLSKSGSRFVELTTWHG
jgi:hypothetical protein